MNDQSTKKHALDPALLRWRIDESQLPFRTTREVDPTEGVVGQEIAIEAMRFGVETDAPGQNVFVRGVSGTGRMTLIRSLLQELKPKARRRLDRCYVHNFGQPDHPRLITLPVGQGHRFRRMMKDLATFIQNRLAEALESPPLKARRESLQQQTQNEINGITQPLEQELQANNMTLVKVQSGQLTQTAIFPVVDGEPVAPEQYRQLAQSGKVSEAEYQAFESHIDQYSKRFQEVSETASRAYQNGLQALVDFNEQETRNILNNLTSDIRRDMPQESVTLFLEEVIDDVIENRVRNAGEPAPDPHQIYGVNVISCAEDCDNSPVVIENTPSVANLLGTIEPEFIGNNQAVTNYQSIGAGSLVQADGGYLVLDANDVLTEPGAWRVLMRALRTGSVDIVPVELGWPFTAQSLKPDPIDISVRVIMLGNAGLYYQLDQLDQDFSNLFKVLADFDSEIERSMHGVSQYAGVVARMCSEEDLLHFDASGVAALTEHGARIASKKGKITARFGRVADIVREASFLAKKSKAELVNRDHVEETVKRTKYRASLPSRRFQELINEGTIWVATQGDVVGQINGLAVISAGPLSYGFPARITATIGAGRAGIINIEGAASMSGSIHTKGFHILGGLLRHLLRTEHPLAFSASIAFEQSYGGIDGDSASGAETCCLISALTGKPIRQSLSMTGAIDQHGHIQAIGGVNEKIEGFFDACKAMGLTGDQGVIIPQSNAGDLMLRKDVVEACEQGQFTIYPVSHVNQAMEILMCIPAGEPNESGDYPEGSLLYLAKMKALEYWMKTLSNPAAFINQPEEGKED